MPSPVGHALAGLLVHAASARESAQLSDRVRAGALAALAIAPDLDLLLRFVDGRNHHGHEMHSVGAAALVALGAWLLLSVARVARPAVLAAASGTAWLSHVLLDYLNVDTNPPIGIMALWPFESGFHKVPWPIFLDIGRDLDWTTVRHDTLAVAWEAAVLAPCLWLLWRRRRRALG